MKRKYCILGETLKHTMSPPIHKRLFELRDREFEYKVMEISLILWPVIISQYLIR